ncbi:hypothetical protein ABIC99_002974 [Sphaerotilus sulfidivorans]|uniref:Uncharacterized protein n=1 Tax=Sphaerotilus sulfidivorans TaxID=639200 RepID=A0ABV2ISA8_9BURK
MSTGASGGVQAASHTLYITAGAGTPAGHGHPVVLQPLA